MDHGTRTIHRRGTVQHVDLCACCKSDPVALVASASTDLEVKAAVDILARRVVESTSKADVAAAKAEGVGAHLAEQAAGIYAKIEESKVELSRLHGMAMTHVEDHEARLVAIAPEIKAIVDALARRVVDAEAKAEQAIVKAQEVVMGLGYQATNMRAEIDEAKKESLRLHKIAMSYVEKHETRLIAAESVTLWALVKRCFGL